MKSVANTIFSKELPSVSDLESRYPPRNLPEGAMVTRVGPSPTGLMHIGTLYVGLLSHHFASQTDGVSFLRVEDTDKKREVEGATDFILNSFQHFGIEFNEGLAISGEERGLYGPYTQSERKSIYHAYVKQLLEHDKAYLCFCTAEELNEIREKQNVGKVRPGYYGAWAKWRSKSEDEALAALDSGMPYVVRFRSGGDVNKRRHIHDLIAGDRELPENDQDIVLLKSDGLPTYHLAHAVDDHLMRTTHVIRGDEWLPSLPTHLQLFEALGWDAPQYAHIAPINKMDGTSRRKLSKRKDPEASVGYFVELGYPPEAIIDYLLQLANSNFEDWRLENPKSSSLDFSLSFAKLQNSNGPLFDFSKLESISKETVANLDAEEILDRVLRWADNYDVELAKLIRSDLEYSLNIFSIERGGEKARKDIYRWSEISEDISYFFDSAFSVEVSTVLDELGYVSRNDVSNIASDFLASYDPSDDSAIWFDGLKQLAAKHEFALRPKDHKKNPGQYKGAIADFAKIFRLMLTGRARTPDLYSVMKVMGAKRINDRVSRFVT